MATCPKCNKPCPDTAAHCGYCGAALPGAPAPKKTMFGYAAPTSQPARAQPAPEAPRAQPAPAPRPQPAPTPIVPRPIEPGPARSGRTAGHAPAEAMAKTQYSAAASPLPAELVQQGMPAPAALRRSQPHPTQPPANEPVPATLYAPAQQAPGVLPTVASPASAIPATAFAPAAEPAIPATVLRPAEQPVPATVFAGAVAPAPVVAASAAARPDVSRPVLASQTLADDLAPVEPGRGAMRVLMTIGGLLLIGLFCAPWGRAGDALVFSWDQLKHLGALEFVARIYLAAGGLVFLVAGLLPLPYLLRAITATVLGLVPIGGAVAQGQDWRPVVLLIALVLLPAALFHRWRYRGSVLARILVGVGVAAVLTTFLVPVAGSVPLVQSFEGLGDASASVIVARLYPLLLFLLSLLSLLAFLGSGSTGLTQIWAVLLILFLPLQVLLTVVLSLGSGSLLAALPQVYGAIVLLVSLTLSTLGISHLMAKGSRPA